MNKIIKFLIAFFIVNSLFAIGVITLHYIPMNDYSKSNDKTFYLSNNGDHIDFIFKEDDSYKAYGWGSKIFFTEVQTWDDLTYSVGFKALFTEPESLIRVVEYKSLNTKWYKVNCSEEQYKKVREYIKGTFKSGMQEYSCKFNYSNTKFYLAQGNYSVVNTCNTWANKVLKSADLKCVVFTMTSDAITDLYEK